MSVAFVLEGVDRVEQAGLDGSVWEVSPASQLWFELLGLVCLTAAVRLGWKLFSSRQGRRRVREVRRSLMRSGALVDAAGMARGVNAGMNYRLHAEPRGTAEPALVCRVPLGAVPLAFAMRPHHLVPEAERHGRLPVSPRFDERYVVEAAPAALAWHRILPTSQRHRAEGLCDLEVELQGEALVVRQPRVREHEIERVVRFATELGASLLETAEREQRVTVRTVRGNYRRCSRVEQFTAATPPAVSALRRRLRERRQRPRGWTKTQRLVWTFAFYGAVLVWAMLR